MSDSVELSATERADGWRETTTSALVTTQFRLLGEEALVPRLRTMGLGPAQLSVMTYASLRSQRTAALIRKSDPELYQLAYIGSGRQSVEQAGRTAVLGRGEMVLYDSSRPFDAAVAPGPERSTSIVVQFPRKLLPLADRQVARLLAVPIPGGEGVGRLLARFLAGLRDEGGDCTDCDRMRLGSTALDLIGTVVAHHLDREKAMPADSRQRMLFLRIRAFVEEHLGVADLGPAAIASAHHISLRTLHRVFRHHGTTVAAFIRQQRLERCRRDLADPGLGRLTVGAIAARWGFSQAPDFTRAFRTAYGMPPSEYRRLAPDERVGTHR